MTRTSFSLKALVVAGVLVLPGLVSAADPAMMKDGMMTDMKGMTLYTFDKDKGGKSMCNGECAKNWLPMKASTDATPTDKWTVIKRDDGTMQWAHDGMPMYTFVKDMKPGDKMGDGFKDMWHMAKH